MVNVCFYTSVFVTKNSCGNKRLELDLVLTYVQNHMDEGNLIRTSQMKMNKKLFARTHYFPKLSNQALLKSYIILKPNSIK